MGKSDKGRGRQAGKARQNKPVIVDEPVSGAGVGNGGKKPEKAVEQTVQVTEKPSFDAVAYVKSMAWVYPVALVLIMALMLYIRAGPSHDLIFTNWEGNYVNFANDDAVYHMRLVHETVSHFPDRIFYDPFTFYPYGSMVHFGPLFTLIIAGSSLILGLGSPSMALVDAVGAYTPAIMGMLCAVPTYFIGKKLFNRNVGILAAFTLALLPGQFLGRSLLGFTDHHIAEVLFSIVTVAFLIYALDAARSSGLSLAKIRSRDKGALTALGFGLLAGFSFGLYMLTWPGGLIIGMILFLYFVIQVCIDYTKGRDTEYLPLLAAATFGLPAVMVLPYSLTDLYFQLLYYSITQPFFLCLALAGVGFVYGLSRLHKKTNAGQWTFPVALLGMSVVGMLVLYVFAYQIFGLIIAGLQVFTPSGGMQAVAEARAPPLTNLWVYFFWTFPIAILGLAMIAFRTFRDNRPAEWLFLVWNLVMLVATFSQDRFSYYFAVNAALLTGYFVYAVFRAFDWAKFTESWRQKVKTTEDAKRFLSRNGSQVLVFAALACVFLVLITWPATGLSVGYSYLLQDPAKNLLNGHTESYMNSGTGMSRDWYETLLWLKNNTPDPQSATAGFSYDSGSYQKPADGNRYPYPSTAYGVMAWWDYGHMITYVAHRIPDANPFQAGVIANNGTEGCAPFFLSTTEAKAYENAKNLNSRYVLVTNNDANGFIYAMRTWANDHDGWDATRNYNFQGQQVTLPVDGSKYMSTMANRLYHEDCANLSHFRLVYESPGEYYVHLRWIDQSTGMILGDDVAPHPSWPNYADAYHNYQLATNLIPAGSSGYLVYDARPPEKWVKVFEVVDGATLAGKAAPGSKVTASLNLSTGDRTFVYTQTAVADSTGSYQLTVPYATEAMNGTGYSSDVKPLGKYTLTIGNATAQVDVPEHAVRNGETLQVPG